MSIVSYPILRINQRLKEISNKMGRVRIIFDYLSRKTKHIAEAVQYPQLNFSIRHSGVCQNPDNEAIFRRLGKTERAQRESLMLGKLRP